MNIIETDRLILREFTAGDAGFILELLNTRGWLKFIGDRGVKTLEDAHDYIQERFVDSYRKNGFGAYLVMLKDKEQPVGMCGLIKRPELEDPDIGYALLPEYEGKGYAFEAAWHTLHYAKTVLMLPRILAITNADNVNSINLLNKLGLRYEKMMKITENDEVMVVAASLTKELWDPAAILRRN